MKRKLLILSVLLVLGFTVYAAYAAVNEVVGVWMAERKGAPLIGLNYPTYVDTRVLAAGVAESHTVPTGATIVAFSSNGDFYANYSTTAAVPVADVTNGSGSELNPGLREITGVTTISLIAPGATIVTVSFYKGRP